MRYEPKKYRVYFQKRSWKPVKFISYGYKQALKTKEWFKSKGIKAYVKRINKK